MSVKKKASGRRSIQVEVEVAGSAQSAVARRSAEAEVSALIDKFAPAHLRLIAATRRCLKKCLPTAHEIVYEYRDNFVISYSPNEHGYEGVLAIRASADGVRLYFNQGKDLPDPEKLLHGSSQTRFIDVEGASTLARPAVARLIEEAIGRNRVPFAGRWSFVRQLPRSVAPPNALSAAKIQSQGAIMSVKKEASGRRSIQVEVEVPGTPEEVWQAIATGPGISSWFVPTEFEEQDSKPVAVKMNFGPGMESRAVMTAWDPPRMFAAEAAGWTPEMPPMATEWTVEAKAGGTCIVRVVHSLFAATDDWDNQLEGTEHGWPGFFRTLRIYLTHFRGQRSAIMQKIATAAGTEAEVWETLTTAMGLKGLSVGQRWTAPKSVPALSGVVEHITQSPNDVLVRLDKPGPGVAALGTYNCGQIMVGVNLYLYGDQAAANVARETPLWQAWIQERFPMPAEPGKSE